eukprot:1973121-Prymnesium_polylepis.1
MAGCCCRHTPLPCSAIAARLHWPKAAEQDHHELPCRRATLYTIELYCGRLSWSGEHVRPVCAGAARPASRMSRTVSRLVMGPASGRCSVDPARCAGA